ncbi:hypothetical protein H6G54_26345 [Anabaena cylindrica FACHB-243]|uniref:Leucine rich repeat variant-containing protein n=1 Tax=Anabaena cylindrica (strain ATCC 27899 / PCC 7122) TaxID=272123 RepID=K9ZFE2_ANACC|nr:MULTISPECIES: leucine rich repeat variant-containing protein [Anabaena]AFZ57464.1 leucine rich repeat variant-containing protein [Anabaena cylindrica PCC 7122]MBD2421145.1 hypothetical protein [Anabaena cylindrica FACHB-243]MBY5281148.1 hypothetical protein [Anabaena sp. CCAP 1446/1C]MBY5308558.1 hypothetical protein [Anabaena sp. CCAP 1446/1C]MCM2405900.1 hypothetical protein [Anabaena sp. CCAP 1446/1C]
MMNWGGMMELLRSLTISDLEPFIAEPTQLNGQSIALQLAVASYSPTPRPLLEVLVNSPHAIVSEAAQLHINWAGEISEDGQNAVEEVLESRYLGQNDKLAVELLKIAPVPPCFLSEWVPNRYLIQALSNPYLPPRYHFKLLERLAKEPSLEPRLQVAEDPQTPLTLLESLAGDLELAIRLSVSYNPSCPPELVRLVQEQHEIASDFDTDAEQLANLAQSRWDCIRLAVAKNPSTSQETLLTLAADKVLKIRLAVAKNSVTSAKILAVLAASDQEIQSVVAAHENVTEEILHCLFTTQQGIIKNRANLPVSILERVFNQVETSKNHRDLFFRQPNTPTWILERFADVDVEAMRQEKAARRPHKPELIETWTAEALDFLVDIAKHPQVSEEILEKFAQYPNENVRLAVAQNTKATEKRRLQLLLVDLVINSSRRIKVKIAEDANTPIAILEQLAAGVLFSFRQKILEISQPIPNFSLPLLDTFLDKFIEFCNRYYSPEQILYWLRDEEGRRVPILRDWDELINTLDEQQKQQVTAIGGAILPAIGLNGDVHFLDRIWLKGSPFDTEAKISPNYLLYGLLLTIGISDSSDWSEAVVVALLGNPSVPNDLRDRIWQKYRKEPDRYNRHSDDASLRLALGYNSAISELKRHEYIQQAFYSEQGYGGAIAKHPDTPAVILEQIAQKGVGGLQEIVKNPNAPVHLLEQAVEKIENSYGLSHTLIDVAQNPNTPIVLLKQLALTKGNNGVAEAVLKNLHLDQLTKYQIQLELQKREETSQANQLLANRPHSSYALAQVLETGDQKAKIIAAGSKKTPITILEQLAKDSDATIRQVVCQNPNLPLPILLNLTQDENLNVRLILVRNRSSQIEILKRLAHDESELVRAEIAGNKNTPVEILTQLAQDSSRRVWEKLTGNQNTPVEVLEFLGVEKKLANAYNRKTPGNALAAVVEDTLKRDSRTQGKVFEYLLRNLEGSQMPASTLEKLSTNTTSWIRSNVAHHRNTPLSALEKMIDDTYEPVLWGIARNPNSSPQLLEKLLNKHDEEVTGAMVERNEIPVNLMARLLENKSQYVREVIALSHNLPPELMAKIIATEPEEPVLISLARNPNLTLELLTQFIQHSNANVRIALVRHPNLTAAHWQQLAQDRALPIREAVAASGNVPAQVLELLSTDEKVEVRLKVARNSRTPESALVALTRDEDLTVRTAVATNPNLPSPQLEQLARDEKVEVRRAVAKNPHTPAALRASLEDLVSNPTVRQTPTIPTLRGLSRIYNPQTDDLETVLSEYVESDVPFVRLVALLHPLTAAEVLQKGAQSVSWLERYAVADNPATPTEIKQQLTEDSNQIVRAVARASLN